MITRRSVVLAGAIGLLGAHRLTHGQPAATIRRVGWLSVGSKAPLVAGDAILAFKQGMHDLGWLEGKNVEYQIVYANGDVGRLDALAGELVGGNVEVVVAPNGQTARAFQRATKTVPIVMGNVGNVVGAGLVASLAKPGGNITGITTQLEEVLGKLIGILHEIAPGARRVAIVLNETTAAYPVYWAAAQSACTALDLTALRIVASAPAQFGDAVGEIVRQRSQAVVVVTDPIFVTERVKLQALMQTTRLPVAYGIREPVDAGGLLKLRR